MLDDLGRVDGLPKYSHARETLRHDVGGVSSTEEEGYALPHEFVSDWVSSLVAEVDVDDADVEMIAFRSAKGRVHFAVWSHDTRAVSFERVLQVHREKVLVLDDENTATV
jgi:hypothetical protein